MNPIISAGIIMYRWNRETLELLLGHPGGPFYTKKDRRFWGIPKGHVESSETILEAALREFNEETGLAASQEHLFSLGKVIECNGKHVYAWAFCGDCDTSQPVNSNLFEMEWPVKSGNMGWYPEIDRLEFFDTRLARYKIEFPQVRFIDRLEEILYAGYRQSKAL